MRKGVIVGLSILLIGGLAYAYYRMSSTSKHLSELKINDVPGVNQNEGELSKSRPKTVMVFDQLVHDFGTMQEGEEKEYAFRFTNNGNEPLYIESAKGSCGCTVPMWPREAIAPGSSGEIKVKFNSKNKKGNNQKKVTLISNTDPIATVLTITAQVE